MPPRDEALRQEAKGIRWASNRDVVSYS